MAFYVMGRYQQAIGEFEAGFAIEPAPAFIFNLGQCHSRLGHKQEALELYRAYLGMHPREGDLDSVQKLIDGLERELHPAAPVALEPSPSPTPAPVAAAPAIVMTPLPPPPSPRKRRAWLIPVGVAAGLLVAGVTVGLAIGLTQSQEPSLLLSAR
jgi:tetratricopeptide (TPR) repeat protein